MAGAPVAAPHAAQMRAITENYEVAMRPTGINLSAIFRNACNIKVTEESMLRQVDASFFSIH